MGRIEEVSRTEVAPVVQASTSLISPGSTLPRDDRLKLAHKLLTVSSRIMRVLLSFLDQIVGTDLFVFISWQEVLGEGSSQPPDNSKLDALRGRVKTLSSEKAALQEKIKKLSKAKKG